MSRLSRLEDLADDSALDGTPDNFSPGVAAPDARGRKKSAGAKGASGGVTCGTGVRSPEQEHDVSSDDDEETTRLTRNSRERATTGDSFLRRFVDDLRRRPASALRRCVNVACCCGHGAQYQRTVDDGYALHAPDKTPSLSHLRIEQVLPGVTDVIPDGDGVQGASSIRVHLAEAKNAETPAPITRINAAPTTPTKNAALRVEKPKPQTLQLQRQDDSQNSEYAAKIVQTTTIASPKRPPEINRGEESSAPVETMMITTDSDRKSIKSALEQLADRSSSSESIDLVGEDVGEAPTTTTTTTNVGTSSESKATSMMGALVSIKTLDATPWEANI